MVPSKVFTALFNDNHIEHLTMFSTGRGDTAHCFLTVLGPRRLKQRYASQGISAYG
jgi:hypothetical protein